MMAKNLPRISVIIPSFNQANFLEATIQSVLSQDYRNLELIIMDGGSNDGSAEIINRYADQIAFSQSEPDGGQPNAISAGFDRATGEVLTYLNSDDILLPGALMAVANAWLPGHQQVIYGHHQIIDGTGRIREKMWNPPYFRWIWYRINPAMPQPGTFFGASLYQEVGGIDTSLQYAFDLDLFMRFVHHRAEFVHTHHFMSAFRRHEDQKGRSRKWAEINRQNEAEIRSRHPVSQGSINFARRLNQILKGLNGNLVKTLGFRLVHEGRIVMYHASRKD